RGVTPDGKLRPTREQAPELYKESPVGWIPREWEVDNIGDLFHIQLGKMLSKVAKTGKWSARYLANKNIQWDNVNLSNLEQMDFSPTEREKYKLIVNDLLVCEGGDVGRTSMWRGEIELCFYQKAIHRLRPKDKRINPALMLRFMRYYKQIGAFSDFTSQTSIAHLTQEQLRKVKVLIPTLMEQLRMIEGFDYIDDKISAETTYSEKLKAQKSGLMHDLLTGKVQVKI
ncbi:MAG: restriction endonuclease subunit S, partial [Desulfamplus sp.]|nr:restriction endonuclease subunit S [Desulfamplus sp.]